MSLAERRVRQKRAGSPDPAILLAWYDRHRRTLPWRSPNGERQDPYRVWLSEIMLQQTTVKAVGPYYARFLTRWPTIEALAAAPLDDVLRLWAGLGYYARARNLHACAKVVVERHGGHFPQREADLRALPGIGDYTASAIAAIAFDVPVTPVDGNVERVVARLFAVAAELPTAKPAIRAFAASLTPSERAGDFAQALMDLGATLCTPKKPLCGFCPWNDPCTARNRGDPESFPRKAEKAAGQLRRGAAFVVVRADGAMLARTRPERGLLGGMTEVPTTEWSHDFDEEEALRAAPRVSPLPKGEQAHALASARTIVGELKAGATGSPLPNGERDRVRGLQDSKYSRNPLTPTLSPRGRGSAPLASQPCGPECYMPAEGCTCLGEKEMWRRVPGIVTHTFTHFPLELVVYVTHVDARTDAPQGLRWIAASDIAGEAFPSLMRKVLAHARIA